MGKQDIKTSKAPPSNHSWKPLSFIVLATITPVALLALHFYRHPHRLQNPSYSGLFLFAIIQSSLIFGLLIPYFRNPLRNLPTPPGVSFWAGHGGVLLKQPAGPGLHKMAVTTSHKGLLHFGGFFHYRSRLLLVSPEALQEVLVTRAYDYEKPAPARRFLKRVLGEGLVVSEGQEHKIQRKSVTPAFQGQHVRALVPLFWRKATDLVQRLTEQLEVDDKGKHAGNVELAQWASKATLDIIGMACVGRDFDSLHNDKDPLAMQYRTITRPKKGQMIYFAVNMLFPPWLVSYIPWKMNRMILAATQELRRVCRQLIADKKASLDEEKKGTKSGEQQKDILSILMRSGQFDDDGLVNQLLTFLAAGHDTTSNSLVFCAYLLATHPEVQTKLREEVLAHLPPDTDVSHIDADIVDSMPYLHAVTSETLRFFPTIPVTSRMSTKTTEIQGTPIPKGTQMIICPWLINRNPDLWGSDAGEFKPERWMPSSSSERDPTQYGSSASTFAFSTFIHGPRSCIGQTFARYELNCLVAALVGRYHLEMQDPDEVVELAGGVAMKPKNGMRLRLQEV